jgi:hypothetical protein
VARKSVSTPRPRVAGETSAARQEEPAPEARAAFIQTGRPDGQSAGKQEGRKTVDRDGVPYRKLTFYLPNDLAKRLQKHAVDMETDMTKLVEQQIEKLLSEVGS